jgi:hypothetical protein
MHASQKKKSAPRELASKLAPKRYNWRKSSFKWTQPTQVRDILSDAQEKFADIFQSFVERNQHLSSSS